MRIGEVLGLQWWDVDFIKKKIHVRRDMDFRTEEIGEVKTKPSLRDIPIPDELYNALLAVRGIGNVFVKEIEKVIIPVLGFEPSRQSPQPAPKAGDSNIAELQNE